MIAQSESDLSEISAQIGNYLLLHHKPVQKTRFRKNTTSYYQIPGIGGLQNMTDQLSKHLPQRHPQELVSRNIYNPLLYPLCIPRRNIRQEIPRNNHTRNQTQNHRLQNPNTFTLCQKPRRKRCKCSSSITKSSHDSNHSNQKFLIIHQL